MVITQTDGTEAQPPHSRTAKLHVSPEVADLVKIFCVLRGEKMVDFVNEVLDRELCEFKMQLNDLKKLRGGD